MVVWLGWCLGKVGGTVGKLNIRKVNSALCKSLRLVVASKNLIGAVGFRCEEVKDLEREIREAAGECQRWIDGKTVDDLEPSPN